MVSLIESEYDVKTLLFNWEGSGGHWWGFPESNARAAADDFYSVLNKISIYKRENMDHLINVNFSVLTHSMGSLVLEEVIIKYSERLEYNILKSIVISASASNSRGHSQWLSKIRFAESIYVVVNYNDIALTIEGLRRGLRLGKGLRKMELAENAIYVDLSKTGVNHRYFIATKISGSSNGQRNNSCIKRFFRESINGRIVNFKKIADKIKLKSGICYSIKDVSTNNDCSPSI